MNTATRKRILYSALVALPLLLALSYPWRDEAAGIGMILSLIGWFGFLLALLVILVVAGAMVMASVRTRRRSPTRT
jgi:hypothetical protein